MGRGFIAMETERTPLKSVRYTPINDLSSVEQVLPQYTSDVRSHSKNKLSNRITVMCCTLLVSVLCLYALWSVDKEPETIESAAWSSVAAPFSTVNPADIGIQVVQRPFSSQPGPIFNALKVKHIPLPTNGWYENFFLGLTNNGPDNSVFQVPYILDTAGYISGLRTHPAHVQANGVTVMVSNLCIYKNNAYL